MADQDKFPGFEVSDDFLTFTALKIAKWTAKKPGIDKPDSRFVYLGDTTRVFIKSEELEARYGDNVKRDIVDKDLELDAAQCTQWSPDGSQNPTAGRTGQVFRRISAIQAMLADNAEGFIRDWKKKKGRGEKAVLPEKIYDIYSNIWKAIATEADKFSRGYTAGVSSDFKFRYYQGPEAPINPPIQLVFSPLVDWIDELTLQELVNGVVEDARKEDYVWLKSFTVGTMSMSDAKTSGLVTYSNHPFGYYQTLISAGDLTRLVAAQMDPQTEAVWNHDFPPAAKVKDADDGIKNPVNFLDRKEFTSTSFLIKPSSGKVRVRETRASTQTIMGGMSANKWAKEKLGWELSKSNAGDTTVAEWLHRSAFSLRNLGGAENEDPDTRANLMFGTQETNTNMLRSETVISRFHRRASSPGIDPDPTFSKGSLRTTVLGSSKKVAVLQANGAREQVDIPSELVWGDKTGYMWLVPELEYTIGFDLVTSRERRSVKYKTTFLPFHRIVPLRPETSLDEKVLHHFFDSMKSGAPPAKKPRPSPDASNALAKAFGRITLEAPISVVTPANGQMAFARTHPLEPIHHSIWDQVTGNHKSKLAKSEAVGGIGGQLWDDSAFVNTPIGTIRVYYGEDIDGIQILYGDNWGDLRGRDGSNVGEFALQDGEVIIRIEGRSSTRLDAIQFFTDKGRSSGFYGGSGGNPFSWNGDRLLYLNGRAGDAVDGLQSFWAKTSNTLASTLQGGLGGQPWSDVSAQAMLPIRGIRITYAGGIDQIQVLFGTSTWGPSHGVASFIEDLFTLQDDEYIIRIEGRSGSRLDAIRFFTNKGRSSPPYGDPGGGNAFSWSGQRLLYFNGRAGDSIDALQAVWETEPTVLVPSQPLHVDITNRMALGPIGGGSDLNPFDDTSFAGCEMKSIIVSVLGNSISCIQIEYAPGGRVIHGEQNLDDTVTSTFDLEPGEYITTITGSSIYGIISLQFITNFGQISPRYGGSGGDSFEWVGDKLLYLSGSWTSGQIETLQSHWAQVSRNTGVKISNPVCLPATPTKRKEVPTDAKSYPPLEGFVLQGDIELFGVPSLVARFTSWQGPPPPTAIVRKDVVPIYHQAEIDSLCVTAFLPMLANTSWAEFQLDQVLVIYQNAQFDPTRTIGWHLEASIIIDERYGKVHDALTNFFHIPNESLTLRARAGMGPQHSWDALPAMSGFCLEGLLDLVTKEGAVGGIPLSKDITLSQIGVRLLGISSHDLGLQAKQMMDYGFGLFGTLHIQVSGSTVPLELEFEVSEMGDLVQIKAGLSGALWQNVFGSGLNLTNVFFVAMFDATFKTESYSFDLNANLELESTLISLSGHYAAGGDYSLSAFVEDFTMEHIMEIYTHLTGQSITLPSGLDLSITSGSISISKAGFVITVDHVEIAQGRYSCQNATLSVGQNGFRIEGNVGSTVEFDDISLEDVILQVDISKTSDSWNGSFTLSGTVTFSDLRVDAVVHLYRNDADSDTSAWNWTIYGHFVGMESQVALGDIIHPTKGTFLEEVALTDAALIVASKNDPEVSNLNPQRYTIRAGVQICAVLGHIDPFSKLLRQPSSPVLILSASWTKDFGFLLDILLPAPLVIHLGRGITTDPIALRIQTNPIELMIHAGVKVPVAKSPEPLDFQAALSLRDDVVSMQADIYGWWTDPLGVGEEVKIGPHIGLGLDIDLPVFFITGLPSGFSFVGGLAIGQAQAQVAVDISEDPVQELLKGELDNVGIDDLISFASSITQIEIPTPPDFLDFQQLKLYISTGVTIGTENFPAGFSFDAHMTIFGVQLDVTAGIAGGVLSVNADLDRLRVGPLTIQGYDGNQALFSLKLGAAIQHLEIDGAIEFLGLEAAILLTLDILPTPSFFFTYLLAFTDLMLYKVEARAAGLTMDLKDLSKLDFTLTAEFEQHILTYIRDQVIAALGKAKQASDEAIEAAKEEVEEAKKKYEDDIQAAQTTVNDTYTAWQTYSANQRAEAQRIRQDYSNQVAVLQKKVDDERTAFNVKLKQAEGDVQHANANRATEMQKAQAAVVKAQNDWDNSVRDAEQKLEDAKRTMREKFGSAESDIQNAENRVNSLQNQINDIEHTINDYKNAHWYEVWKKSAIPGLEIAKASLYVAKGVADGVLAGCQAILAGADYIATRDAIPALEGVLEGARETGDAGFKAAQLAVHGIDVTTQGLVDVAVKALQVVQNGGDLLWKQAEKALADFIEAGKEVLAGAQKLLDDLESAVEWVAYQAATAALSLARASTHALDVATQALDIAEHGIDGTIIITEDMVAAITGALDITRVSLSGSYNAIAGGGQFDAAVFVTLAGQSSVVRIKFRIGSVSDFIHDLLKELI